MSTTSAAHGLSAVPTRWEERRLIIDAAQRLRAEDLLGLLFLLRRMGVPLAERGACGTGQEPVQLLADLDTLDVTAVRQLRW